MSCRTELSKINLVLSYQRPSRELDLREPLDICTKTFANSTYPGPVFLHKKLLLSLPQEHNLKGHSNCNVIPCIIFNKSLTIIYTVSKNSKSTCFLHKARFRFIPCKSESDNFNEHTLTSACIRVYRPQSYHRFRWYATLENKTPAETFPNFPSVLLTYRIEIHQSQPASMT